MRKKIIIILLLLLSITHHSHAQGCNDAGLCSMGDLDGKGLGNENKFNTQLTYIFGLGEQQSLVNTILFEQKFPVFHDRGQLFIQLPFNYIYGKLGQSYGLGDASLGFNYTYFSKENITASFLVAAKLPPNSSNKTIDGKGAPMVYQTSLGTYDLAIGANLFVNKWQLGLGYINPLGSNKNYYDPEEWTDNDDAQEYIQMQDLARGEDAMLRLNRFFYTSKNRFNAGLLALYRMQKDKVTQNGQRISLENSDGFTLNINFGYYKVLKNKDAISLSVAAPIITREVRVDGLTRTFVIMFTYAFSKKDRGIFEELKFN